MQEIGQRVNRARSQDLRLTLAWVSSRVTRKPFVSIVIFVFEQIARDGQSAVLFRTWVDTAMTARHDQAALIEEYLENFAPFAAEDADVVAGSAHDQQIAAGQHQSPGAEYESA